MLPGWTVIAHIPEASVVLKPMKFDEVSMLLTIAISPVSSRTTEAGMWVNARRRFASKTMVPLTSTGPDGAVGPSIPVPGAESTGMKMTFRVKLAQTNATSNGSVMSRPKVEACDRSGTTSFDQHETAIDWNAVLSVVSRRQLSREVRRDAADRSFHRYVLSSRVGPVERDPYEESPAAFAIHKRHQQVARLERAGRPSARRVAARFDSCVRSELAGHRHESARQRRDSRAGR